MARTVRRASAGGALVTGLTRRRSDVLFIIRIRTSLLYGVVMGTGVEDRDPAEVADRLAAIQALLQLHDVALTLEDDRAVLGVDGRRLERPWGLREPEPLDGPEQSGWFLLADSMTPARAAVARARGHWYADLTGRIYVRAPGVLIDVDDRRARLTGPDGRPARGRRGLVQNPMSPSRAQVVCVLLDDPRLVSGGLRALAERSGASLGVVQQVMSDLEARRFLRHGRSGLNRVDELIDQWAGAFGNGLGPRLELGRFSGDPALDAWVATGRSVYLSGEAASPEITGEDVTIYVEDLDVRAVLASRWSPGGDRPNIVVRRKFWATSPRVPGVHEALLPLRLADLLVTDDPRHRLAARPLREEILERHAC